MLRTHPAAQNRFIYANGQLHKLPNSIKSLLRKQDPFSKSLISQVWREPFIPKSELEDESVYDFCHRRFGQEVSVIMQGTAPYATKKKKKKTLYYGRICLKFSFLEDLFFFLILPKSYKISSLLNQNLLKKLPKIFENKTEYFPKIFL